MRWNTQARALIAVVTVVTVCLMSASSSLAAKPTVFTDITKNGVDTYHQDDPQCGITGQVTLVYNNVFHITDRGEAGFLVHANVASHITIVGDNGVTYTGHSHLHFDAVGTRGNTETYIQTLTINLVGDDGSRISMTFVDRISMNANGDITTAFNTANCH